MDAEHEPCEIEGRDLRLGEEISAVYEAEAVDLPLKLIRISPKESEEGILLRAGAGSVQALYPLKPHLQGTLLHIALPPPGSGEL